MIEHTTPIPIRSQRIHGDVDGSFGHAPRENKILRYKGDLYGFATVPRRFPHPDDKEAYHTAVHTFPNGLLGFRRGTDGAWTQIVQAETPWCSAALVGPDGTFWMEGTDGWENFVLSRTRTPEDFHSFERAYERPGTSVYGGVSISPEGNVHTLHAGSNNHHAGAATVMHSAFYEAATDSWHRQEFETPEGRNGYSRMLVTGKSVIGVCRCAMYETTPHYAMEPEGLGSGRHVRLFACEDLTTQPLRVVRWLTPPYGNSELHDLFRAPDGHAYLAYQHVSAETYEDSNRPMTTHLARFDTSLTPEVFDLGIPNGYRPCPHFDAQGRWFLSYLDSVADRSYLVKLDPDDGFRPTDRYPLGDGSQQSMVLFVPRPEQFGGEGRRPDEPVGFITKAYRSDDQEAGTFVEAWYGEFDLPK